MSIAGSQHQWKERQALVLPPSSLAPGPAIIPDAAFTPELYSGAVLLLGNFDGFHCGHQALLEVARRVRNSWNARLPIGVMSAEPHPRTLFGYGSPAFRLTSFSTKCAVLGRFGIDFLYVPHFDHDYAGQSPEEFVETVLGPKGLGVRHVVCGSDFRFGHKRTGGVSALRSLGASHGFGVSEVPAIQIAGTRCSSSLVRSCLAAGDISGARQLLNYDWFMDVEVSSTAGPVSTLSPNTTIAPLLPGTYHVAIEHRSYRTSGSLLVDTGLDRAGMALSHCRSDLPTGDMVRIMLLEKNSGKDASANMSLAALRQSQFCDISAGARGHMLR